jgi:lipoprotein-anchoring transpeptidase ErfK/SrfK
MGIHSWAAQGHGQEHGRGRKLQAGTLALATGVLLAVTILSACAPSSTDPSAKQLTRLNNEISTARTVYHVPPSLLGPILAQEQQAAVGAHGTSAQKAHAATVYSQLYQQVVAIEHANPQQARTQAQSDLNQLTSVLGGVQAQGFIEAAPYAQDLQQAQQQFASASTTTAYFTLATQVEAEIAAVSAIEPTYQQMSALQDRVQALSALTSSGGGQSQPLECAQGQTDAYWYQDPYVNVTSPSTSGGSNAQVAALESSSVYANWYPADLALFRTARTAADYSRLQQQIAAQNAQLTADQTMVAPQIVSQLLQTLQQQVSQYQQDGGTDQTYQHELAQDQQTATANSFSSAVLLEQTLEQQLTDLQLPLAKVKTQHDLTGLQKLLAQGQAQTTVDPANGQAYPDAYEYADASTGIGDPKARLANAQTLQDYQDVDREILMFSTNLTALLQNLNDSTPSTQPHKTDQQLMQYYGTTSGKVIVVSVREQEARFYDNGKLVQAYQVTTGAPDLPSPVGIHCVLEKLTHTVFKSPDPPGSPNYYQPTPINYALMYSYYGYFLHDAWWRTWFGKYSNLPHYDPAAFNGGSHGCINFALNNAAWMYNWADLGTPVIVY